jgi:dTDP-4-amino-4,6-dideoxygalactose transaminase
VIPLVDLRAQYQSIKPDIDAAVLGVLERGQFVLGEEVASFEAEFAAYCQTRYALGVNNGTSALHLALLAAGVGPGDEVITVPFTFVATVAAIEYAGARPVFVDIDPTSLTMDPRRVEAAITPRTRALLPVHLHGQAADMDPLLAIARRHGLVVIEDAAQAHGAEYKGRRVGSIGDLGCFSFYPGKNLGAYGEGGAITTNNPDYAQQVRLLRDWGSERRYQHQIRGFNCRLEALQGAILRVKLRKIEAWTILRRRHAACYSELLTNEPLQLPTEMPYGRHVYHVYSIRTRERPAYQHALEEAGIQSGIHYPIPVHLQPAYADLGHSRGCFPHAERAADEVLSLPLYPELSDEQLDRVADALRVACGV